MNDYIARFKIKLKHPIKTSEILLSKLTINPVVTMPFLEFIKSVEITPVIDESKILGLDIAAIYSGEHFQHLRDNWSEKHLIISREQSMLPLPPWEVSVYIIMPLVNRISGLTQQAHIFRDMRENLEDCISDFTWELPDGSLADFDANFLRYPKLSFLYPPDLFGQPLNSSDWTRIQDIYNGEGQDVPLWKMILANAQREQQNDIRNTIIQCATALDVGIQPLIRGRVDKFDMAYLRGEGKLNKKDVVTQDLRITDESLYNTLSRLWFTRHAIVHKGDPRIYEDNPISGAEPVRAIDIHLDPPEFLKAVPKGIKFVEDNPP